MFLEGLVIVSLCLAVFGTFLLLMHQSYQRQMDHLTHLMTQQMIQFQKEKMDLLNRAASKDWQTYIQVSQSLTPENLSSVSDEPYYGMSDEQELARMGANLSEARGNGEVLVDVPTEEALMSDLRELGLVDDD